jgi:uncharacterized protein DUF4440
MKRLTMILAAVWLCGTSAGFAQVLPARGAPAPPTSALALEAAKTEQALQQAEKERFEAMVKADVGALDRLVGPELIYTHTNAQVQDKGAFIGDIRTKAIRYLSIEPSDLHVTLFGTTAVVTGAAALHVMENGNDLTIKVRYTNVQINRHGEWQMVAWQATKVP